MQPNTRHHAAGSRGHPQSRRAERRAAQREAAKLHKTAPRRSIAAPALLSAALVVAVALGFLAYVAFQGGGSKAGAIAAPQEKAFVNLSTFSPATTMLKVGAAAPNFTLRDDTGFSYSLAAQRGHPVVLEFFALWCPHCHQEAPIMHAMAKTYVPKGVTVWAILANPYGQYWEMSQGKNTQLADRTDFSWYAQTFNVNYPLLIDPNFATVNRYTADGYPTIYFVNSAGKIAYTHAGVVPYDRLSKQLSPLLKAGR